MITKILPPKTKWYTLANFELSKIPQKFEIASFERMISPMHVRRVMSAIRKNEFYDNILRVVKSGDKYEIIDGQHRLTALWRLFSEEGLQTYDIVLQVFESDYARTVFRKLNMGKPLNVQDHTKALDDGTFPFFTELSEFLLHKRSDKKGSYGDMLSALLYARTGMGRPVNAFNLLDTIEKITEADIEKMRQFLSALRIVSPIVKGSEFCHSIIYRNVFRVGYENSFDSIDLVTLFERVQKNPKIKWRLDKSNDTTIREAYKIILQEVLPDMGIHIEPKEREEITRKDG